MIRTKNIILVMAAAIAVSLGAHEALARGGGSHGWSPRSGGWRGGHASGYTQYMAGDTGSGKPRGHADSGSYWSGGASGRAAVDFGTSSPALFSSRTLPAGAKAVNVQGFTMYESGGAYYKPYFGPNGVYYAQAQPPDSAKK